VTSIEEVTIGAFSQPLVGMSFIISVLGSWVGLTCALRARRRGAGTGSWLWLFGAAASIGGGAIWSMHFIGMLAFDSHVAYALDIGTTVISLVVAIVAAMVGMLIATAMQGKMGYVVGGLVTGAGVCAMHYTGMYAMDMSATMVWKPGVVVASVVIALAASALALFFAFNVTTRLMRVAASVIMGIGVCVMHYTGMLALEIHSSPDDKFGHVSGADPVYLAMPIFAISAGMLIVIGFGTMFAGINDDLDEPWTPDQRPRSDSGAHPMMPQRPALGQSSFADRQPFPGQQPGQHQQPLPDDPLVRVRVPGDVDPVHVRRVALLDLPDGADRRLAILDLSDRGLQPMSAAASGAGIRASQKLPARLFCKAVRSGQKCFRRTQSEQSFSCFWPVLPQAFTTGARSRPGRCNASSYCSCW
jgi:NO-binding membrane sensor protein with MHYT domain